MIKTKVRGAAAPVQHGHLHWRPDLLRDRPWSLRDHLLKYGPHLRRVTHHIRRGEHFIRQQQQSAVRQESPRRTFRRARQRKQEH